MNSSLKTASFILFTAQRPQEKGTKLQVDPHFIQSLPSLLSTSNSSLSCCLQAQYFPLNTTSWAHWDQTHDPERQQKELKLGTETHSPSISLQMSPNSLHTTFLRGALYLDRINRDPDHLQNEMAGSSSPQDPRIQEVQEVLILRVNHHLPHLQCLLPLIFPSLSCHSTQNSKVLGNSR